MCGPKGYQFFSNLVIDRVSICVILVINMMVFALWSLIKYVFGRNYLFLVIDNTINKRLAQIIFSQLRQSHWS